MPEPPATPEPKPSPSPKAVAAKALHAKLGWPAATARAYVDKLSDDQVKHYCTAAELPTGADNALRTLIDRRHDAIRAEEKAAAKKAEEAKPPAKS